jgi:hypothetical protein
MNSHVSEILNSNIFPRRPYKPPRFVYKNAISELIYEIPTKLQRLLIRLLSLILAKRYHATLRRPSNNKQATIEIIQYHTNFKA